MKKRIVRDIALLLQAGDVDIRPAELAAARHRLGLYVAHQLGWDD